MEENLTLVSDLALILISAGITTLLFKALKQPLILGYIVAGFLVGPHFGLFPNITSPEGVEQWSEIGIIFMLFGLGLEFSFRKLIQVGSSALIATMTIFLGMTFLGIALGGILGWNNMESLFLGGMLAMSSTTIIIKAFEDLGVSKMKFTGIVYGILVVEDLLAVVLMVLLSTMAVSQRFEGREILLALLKLVFFLILWFVVGMYLIPTLLKKGRKHINEEMLTVLSIGLCFGMVMIANVAGFSSALGAFVMGSLLAETIEAERIEKAIHGIKDLFGAVFFVSVGMMVDPAIIIEYWQPILILTLAVLVARTIFAISGVLLAGQGLESSVRSGMGLAPVGEFAFIIASLGASLGVMSGFIYPVVVAVSVPTTFVTPYFIKLSDPLLNLLQKRLPPKFLTLLTPMPTVRRTKAGESKWKEMLKSYWIRVVVYSVMLLAIFVAGNIILEPLLEKHLEMLSPNLIKLICVAVTLLVMTPFLIGLEYTPNSQRRLVQDLWNGTQATKYTILALIVLRIFIGVNFVMEVIFHYFTLAWELVLLLVFAIAIIFILARRNIRKMNFIEKRFMENYNQKEQYEKEQRPLMSSIKEKLGGYDIHLEYVTVAQNSKYMGMQLKDVPFRSLYGINIIKIIRGDKVINIPSASEHLYPGDKVLMMGTNAQIQAFLTALEASRKEISEAAAAAIATEAANEVYVGSVVLSENSPLAGKSLRMVEMRKNGCVLIGLERGPEALMNPDPDFIFEVGDVVWLAGDKSACEAYI